MKENEVNEVYDQTPKQEEYLKKKYGTNAKMVIEALNKGYTIVYSFDGDLVAFKSDGSWSDWEMWDTQSLEGMCGYVIDYAD